VDGEQNIDYRFVALPSEFSQLLIRVQRTSYARTAPDVASPVKRIYRTPLRTAT